ncbi:zinc finger protein 271-like [Cyprinodon tularosa]|uniref:zinc finger protein 271-like n=1 Tax=Cyprinodon tularosa TaxID=77115 RepID=UPI0018E23730|nr:zinc finger protein 271-like [Cyprinodon tularosa]
MNLSVFSQSFGLRSLTDSLSELLSKVSEDILEALESRGGEASSCLTVPICSSAVKMPVKDESLRLTSDPVSSASSDVSVAESDEEWISIKNTDKKERDGEDEEGQTASSDKPACYRCVICGKTFRHKGNLVRHVEKHADCQENLCGVCGKRLKASEDLSEHLSSHRDSVCTSRTCNVCGKMFQNIETHLRSHTGVKPYSCDICSRSFPRAAALKRHKKIHSTGKLNSRQNGRMTFAENQLEHLKKHGDQREGDDIRQDDESETLSQKENPSLCCRVCGDSFHRPGFLTKHAETHSSDSKCMCGVCGKLLDSSDGLQTHLQSHRETGGTCTICGKSFQNMETHMRIHTGFRPYRCSICCKRFPRPGALRRHKRIHSSKRQHVSSIADTESQENDQSGNADGQNGKMSGYPSSSCKVCGETFQGKGNLRKHAKSHSSESVCGVCGECLPPSETLTHHLQGHREEGKVCHICGNTFQNIETHMRSHTGIRPYPCSICGKSFPRPSALRRHKRIHSGERPYICEFCGKTFTESTSLTAHIRKHSTDRPVSRVSCEICGKSLSSLQVLEVHMRIHTGEKPFPCRICGKAFRQLGGLNAHMLTHTGEKPFSCSLCNKSFSTKGYLETHIRFHKKERAFKCHLCWKAFVTKNDLKKHLLTHTGEKPYSCPVCGKSYQEKRSRDVHMKVHNSTEPIRSEEGHQPRFIQL